MMGPMNFNIYSDAPTMILPPSQDSPFGQSFNSQASFPSASTHHTLSTEPSSISIDPASSSASNGLPSHQSSWTPTTATTPVFTNPSRKRSRDDSGLIDEEGDTPDTSYFPLTPAPPSIPEEEPIYGEGMTLLNPRTGVAIAAESQTGTWYEETAEAAAIAVANASIPLASRPEMPSRKSQRLDLTAPGLDDIASAIVKADSPPKSAAAEPTIDESTQALGIGWMKMDDEDEHLRAAARGWAKYIDNHYSDNIHGAKLLLKSKGLNAYLVGADEGFFLFKEDLTEGGLVGATWERTLANLTLGGGNVQFDGDTLTAQTVLASSEVFAHGDTTERAINTNGYGVGHEKPMTLNEAPQGLASATRVANISETTLMNHGQIDGGMDID